VSGEEPTGRRKAAAKPAGKALEDLLPFDVEDGTGLVWPTREKIWAGIAVWTAYRGARRLCDICVKVIHELGVTQASAPMPATMKRKGPNGDGYHCSRHGHFMKQADVKAEADAKEARARNAHLNRGRR
jgi:hypothetical protein